MAATSLYQLFVFQLLLDFLILGFPSVTSSCLKKTVYHADSKARSILFEGKEGSDVHCRLRFYPRTGFTRNYFLEVTWSMFKVSDDMPDCEKSYIEIYLTRSVKSIGKYCSKDTSFKMFNIYSHDGFARMTYHNKKSSSPFAFKVTYRMRHYQKNYLLYTHTYNDNNTDLLSSTRWPKGPYPSTAYAEVYEIRINKGRETKLIFMDVDLADKACNVGSNSLEITGRNKLGDEKEIIKDRLCKENGYVVTTKFSYIYIQFNKPTITALRNKRGFLAAFVSYYKPYKGATGSLAGDIGLGVGLVSLFILIIIIIFIAKRKSQNINRIHVQEYDKEEARQNSKEEDEIELQNVEGNGESEQGLIEAEILAKREEEERQQRELEDEILKKALAAQLLKETEEKNRAFEEEIRLLSEETDAVIRAEDLQRLADLAEKIATAAEKRSCDTGTDPVRKEEDLKQLTDLTERVKNATDLLRRALEERMAKDDEMRRFAEEALVTARGNVAKRHADEAEQLLREAEEREKEAERKRRADQEAQRAAIQAERQRLAAEAEKNAREAEEREKEAERKRREEQEAQEAAIQAERQRLAAEAEKDAREAEERQKEAEEKRLAEEARKKAIAEARAKKINEIRMQLVGALRSGESQKIKTAVDQAKDADFSELLPDIETATEILEKIKAGENLQDAMSRRHLADLEAAADFIRKKKLDAEYAAALVEADLLIKRLRKLEHLRREILELNQSTISEIRSYRDPPPSVHQVMIAVYLLLGHNEDHLKVWNNMRVLVGKMGKDSLKKLVTSLDASQIDLETAVYAEKTYLSKHDLESIRIISEGAAVFYIWCKSMIEENNAWREDSEKRKRSGKRKL